MRPFAAARPFISVTSLRHTLALPNRTRAQDLPPSRRTGKRTAATRYTRARGPMHPIKLPFRAQAPGPVHPKAAGLLREGRAR